LLYEEITLLCVRSRTLQVSEQLCVLLFLIADILNQRVIAEKLYGYCIASSAILSCNLILSLATNDDDHASITIFS
jgi:hypothetical protein